MEVLGKVFLASVALFQLLCLSYNVILLLATYSNRRSIFLPLSYITVMSVSGILATVFMTLNMWTYMLLDKKDYEDYLLLFGREATVGSTFSYLNSILVTCVMTLNRLVVVIKPFNELFTHTRIFIYCAVIAICVLISLLIPYFSPCSVTFMLNRLSFVSGCAPNRHEITAFQNKYAIFLPLTCMVINLGIILHLRLARNGTYAKIKRSFSKPIDGIIVTYPNPPQNATSKIRARKDFVMMRQTIAVAAYLSIYELGAFVTKVFPDEYAGLDETLRDGYFYIRMESIAFMNFFIYYLETASTRRMIRRYLNLSNEQSSVTVATVAQRI